MEYKSIKISLFCRIINPAERNRLFRLANIRIMCNKGINVKTLLWLVFLLFGLILKSKSQIYQHFIFKDSKMQSYDESKQLIAERAVKEYYLNNLDSAIFFYKKLILLDSNYYQGYYNLAKIYQLNKMQPEAINTVEKYVSISKGKCKCSYLEAEPFGQINDSIFDNQKKLCCSQFESYSFENKLKKPYLLNALEAIDGKEQEILGNTVISKAERIAQLKTNFTQFTDKVDTIRFPKKNEIGKGTAIVQLIILHLDYYPTIQLSLGKKLLHQKKSGYEPKMSAYIIDRALRNIGQPQKYGTLIDKNNKETLYVVDDYQKMVKRRKKLGFQPVEEFLKNKSITK